MLTYFFWMQKLSKPFNEYSQLEEMLALRKLGHSYTVLADKYNVPKETIRYLARRFGLAGKNNTVIMRQRATRVISKTIDNEDIINPGKTYAEYLKEDRERKLKYGISSRQ